jgi:hypothetical protein
MLFSSDCKGFFGKGTFPVTVLFFSWKEMFKSNKVILASVRQIEASDECRWIRWLWQMLMACA